MKIAIEDEEDSRALLSLLDDEWALTNTDPSKNTGETGDAEPAHGGTSSKTKTTTIKFTKYWHDLVSAPDPDRACLAAAISFLDKHQHHHELLALLPDDYGRAAVEVSSPAIKIALQSRLLFCGRYELDSLPVHVSKTCEVVFAKDHQPRFDHFEAVAESVSFAESALEEKEDEELEGDDDQEKEDENKMKSNNQSLLPVALKFMRSRKALEREIRFRRGTEKRNEKARDQKGRREKSCVIEVLSW